MKQIKFIALFLAFIMLLACLPCNAEQDTLPFTDISQDDWFYSDVAFAYENGFVKGKGNNRFAPTDNITYAEAIKLACCMHQHIRKKEVTLKNGSLVWYSTYLDYAKENSIPYEFENYNTFVTRADFIRIIFAAYHPNRYNPVKNYVADDTIPDVKMSDSYANEVYTFYRSGIIIGNNDCEFMPESFISRAEVCAIINRMANPTLRKEVAVVKETKQRRLIIDGKDFTDEIYVEPRILENGQELLQFPLLATSEALGGEITWQKYYPTVTISFETEEFLLELDTLHFGKKLYPPHVDMDLLLCGGYGINVGLFQTWVNDDLIVSHSMLAYYFQIIGVKLEITDTEILLDFVDPESLLTDSMLDLYHIRS